ncbi:MAG: rod shape-determining protein MreC [Clostridiales bacterium]|nr:rod shape-determining protein MreC [Clostridiales bacterium]
MYDDDRLFTTPPEGEKDAPAQDENGYTRVSPAWDEDAPRVSRQVKNRYQALEDQDEAEWRRAARQGDNSTHSGRRFVETDEEKQQEQLRRDRETPRRAQKRREEERIRKEKKKEERKRSAASPQEKKSFARRMAGFGIVAVLFVCAAVMVISNFVDWPILQTPKTVITSVITPVQQAFSGLTESVAGYLRTLKVRGNIEYEYEQLLIKLDDLASEAAMAEEYKRQINDMYDLMDEINRNTDLNPLAANVIGHDTGNYFSVLTINVGSKHGVKDYMAVVFAGGLVGYTYDVEETTCSVRCIIDSDATVFGMIQSTRDQGAVKGTLGIDGQARCRMYYLPENSLPRPGDIVVTSGVGMEFPKGIPIGTVRESTRGMDENKSYIVVEPLVDFQHLEYVVVYRYQPAYAESAQERDTGVSATLEPLVSARPQPTFQVGSDSGFATQAPDEGATESPAPTETPAPTQVPEETATPDPNATQQPENLVYQAPDNLGGTPTAEPTATPTPTPEPTPTFDPGSLTVEEE